MEIKCVQINKADNITMKNFGDQNILSFTTLEVVKLRQSIKHRTPSGVVRCLIASPGPITRWYQTN